jgi:hypothetical protein
MSAKIFISFASQDRGVAMTLCSALESRGFKCWISARDIQPGENFQIAIVRAIREAKIMLLVFTANSNNSDEMSKELALASQNKLMVVPLRVEDVAPNDAFAYEFATRQWIDFFADWEAAIQQLADRIENAMRAHAPVVEVAPKLPPVAIEEAVVTGPKTSKTSVSPAAEPIAPEPSSWAAAESPNEDTADTGPSKPRRTGVYIGLSLALVLAVGVGIVASRSTRSAGKPPESRAMVVMPVGPPAPGAQQAVAAATPPAPPVPPDAATADASADKPAPHKHKAPATKPVEEVPF